MQPANYHGKMLTMLCFFRLIAIVIWIGGVIFFAFVLAPTAFSLLPSAHMAGLVVGGTLRVLDIVGLASGVVFCTSTGFIYLRSTSAAKRRYGTQLVLATIMFLGTVYLHEGILPTMEKDRFAAGGDIENARLSDPAKADFERLHHLSERVEGTVLLLGVALVFLLAGEAAPQTSKIEA